MILPLLVQAATAALPPASPAAASAATSTAGPAAAPVSTVTTTLAPDAEARWVPFDLTPGNQVRFSLLVDGQQLSAILDTGVSFSVVARRFAAEHRLPVRALGNATVIGGAVPIGWVDTGTVTLGGLTRRGGGLAVADLPAAATGGAVPVDMLVGRDLVGAAALDIDYPGRRFRLIRSGRLPFAGAAAPLAISPERQVYVSQLTLGGRTLAPMIVDTGDGSAVTITRAEWQAAVPPGIPFTTALAYGLVGAVTTDLAIVPELRIGALVAREVEVRAEGAGGFSEAIGVAGRIGSGLLGRYRVLLDPGAGRMVLSPGPLADKAPPRSTSGLLMALQPGRLKVVHVMRGSPAAAAGWRAGDLICTVDGRAIGPDYVAGGGAGWSAGQPGRVVRLGLCDGPVRDLTLARFY